jgi:hypothetical protein
MKESYKEMSSAQLLYELYNVPHWNLIARWRIHKEIMNRWTCNVENEINGKIKLHPYVTEVFHWLLGETNDWPAKKVRDGQFYWRTNLRKRLLSMGIEI